MFTHACKSFAIRQHFIIQRIQLSYQRFQSVQSQQMQTAQSELILLSIDGGGRTLCIRALTLCF